MGVVNLAFDPLLKREVAIKSVLRPPLEQVQTWQEIVQRLIREAQAAAALRHPNIVAIYDVIADDDAPSIVMEFVHGKTLSELATLGKPADPKFALQVLKECADALDHAHSRGILHRDIKPSNIMLDQAGSVRLADFGVAKFLDSQTDLTHGLAIGTLEYMSPEQLEARQVDRRTDQYSLAVVAYRILTGCKIFDAPTMGSWCAAVMHQDPAPASERNKSLPRAVDTVLARAMAKSAAARYETCAAFVADLERAMVGVAPAEAKPKVSAPVPPLVAAAEPTGKTEAIKKGLPDWVLIAGGILLATGVIAAVVIHFSGSSGPTITKKEPTASKPAGDTGTTAVVKQEEPAKPPESPNQGQTWKNSRDDESYVYLAPAAFLMGCSVGDRDCNGEAQHDAHVEKGFWVGQTEVQVGAYKKYSQATGTKMPPPVDFNRDWSQEKHPIVNVTWAEAKSFCEWVGGRLPSDVEWEYAARGGRSGERFVSGPKISPAVANYTDNDPFEFTAPVGSFPPNGFGLFDVSGNAAEWVQEQVVRGGSFNMGAESLRLANRVAVDPNRRNFAYGMRCVIPQR
jgi:serine/threonine protein kinase